VKITILVPSLASNGIARAWILANLLQRHYDVEVLGRLREGETVFPWFADYPWVEVRRNGLLEAMQAMERRITGDIVLAYGVSVASFAVGLITKLRRHVPLILDMPEWEVHDHYKWQHRLRRALMITRNLLGSGWSESHSFKYRYILDHLTQLADERTVCCTFLQRRYGGVLLPQGPDTNQFDPAKFDKMAIRRKWGIPEDATILFFGGNPQPNKGLDETIAALHALDGKVKARLVIVGRDATHPYTRRLIDLARGKAIVLGPQPFHLMPELLATADIVALPQTKEPKSRGYVPCKIYEAMAMAIPVISSELCDIPDILDGCGYVVLPEDSGALQDSIEHVLAHPEEAREMGRRARRRVIERYSWEAMDRILYGVVESVASKAARRGVRSGGPTNRSRSADR
jgi:glycosyltransferase involved in cell wall biosynthesis